MRIIGAVLLATAMFASNAYAAGDDAAPLAPGKPAGVKQAQIHADTALWVGIGIIALAAVIVSAGNGNSNNSGSGSGT